MAQDTADLGYLRDPETKKAYFPYTHYTGVMGLTGYVNTTVESAIDGAMALVPTMKLNGANTTKAVWYAPTGAGTQHQLLVANGSGIPSWLSLSGTGYLYRSNNGWSLSTPDTGGIEQVYTTNSSGSAIPTSGSGASITVSDGTQSWRYKISTSAIINDTTETFVLNGDFN